MITISQQSALDQVVTLTREHPKLNVVESNASCIRLCGEIEIYRTACGYTLDRTYNIEIGVPIDSNELPYVIDLDGVIDDSYPHRYVDGKLCLETDTAIRWRFISGFNLSEWVDEYVEPFFFSYEFYKRYGYFPFGERPHDIEGILNTYQDLLQESDLGKVFALMEFCANRRYRGHVRCPCGSGAKLRHCHGNTVFPIMRDPHKKEIISTDIDTIRKAIAYYESQRENY